MREDFLGAILKLERAKHHIDQFEAISRVYIAENLKAMRPVPNPNRWKSRTFGGRLPRHTPTIVGDVIHNARTALDHAYCALVESNGGTVDRYTTFPFHKKRIGAVSSLNGHVKTGNAPSQAVIDAIIDEIQPFEGSQIYGIHILDIADKHHVLIATTSALAIDRLEILAPDGKPTGAVHSGFTVIGNYGDQGSAIGLSGGLGAKLYGDPAKTFDIRFADGQPFAGESILSTLSSLHGLVQSTVGLLAKF